MMIQHTYNYAVCANGTTCPNLGGTGMVTQVDDNDPSLCYYIGFWDENILPSYRSDSDGTWEFTYNGMLLSIQINFVFSSNRNIKYLI